MHATRFDLGLSMTLIKGNILNKYGYILLTLKFSMTDKKIKGSSITMKFLTDKS